MHIAYDQLFIKNKILQLIRINDETPVQFYDWVLIRVVF